MKITFALLTLLVFSHAFAFGVIFDTGKDLEPYRIELARYMPIVYPREASRANVPRNGCISTFGTGGWSMTCYSGGRVSYTSVGRCSGSISNRTCTSSSSW